MDRQEFQYLMDFYRLKSIPIFYKNDYVGKVTRDLQYKKAMLVRLKDKDYAVELAFEQIHDSIEVVKRWKEKTSVDVVFESEKQTWIYDDGCGYETHHVYPKTIKTTKDMVFEGTLDEVFERFYKANSHLRYCNGDRYVFADKKVERKYRIWAELIPESRSFHMYYGNGIVD
jgi:hypothetical protein